MTSLLPNSGLLTTLSPELQRQLKWDRRFLRLAKEIASWSKDPSTQTGAVIVRPDLSIASIGFNGFPRGVDDSPARYADRELKYKLIVHCERNAYVFARESLKGFALYTYPFMSCSPCAGMGIQAGIARHVAPPLPEDKRERWAADMELATRMFNEAGVRVDIVDPDSDAAWLDVKVPA